MGFVSISACVAVRFLFDFEVVVGAVVGLSPLALALEVEVDSEIFGPSDPSIKRQVIAHITVNRNEERNRTEEGVWIAGSSKATIG